VRATIDGFDMGVDVGYACVFLDGLYKGCSVDGDLLLVFDDPGLDFSWHLLEVRFVFLFLLLDVELCLVDELRLVQALTYICVT
jgi:hypothetical protein